MYQVEALQAQLNEAIATMNERTSRGLESKFVHLIQILEISSEIRKLTDKIMEKEQYFFFKDNFSFIYLIVGKQFECDFFLIISDKLKNIKTNLY